MHTITITISDDAQRAALLAGEPAQREQTYDVEGELLLRLLALPWTTLDAAGTATCRVPSRLVSHGDHLPIEAPVSYAYHGGTWDAAAPARPADAEGAIEHAEGVVVRYAAVVRAERAVQIAEQTKWVAKVAALEAAERVTAERWAALPLAWRVDGDGVARCTPAGTPAWSVPLQSSGEVLVTRDALYRHVPAALAEATAEVERLRAEQRAEADRLEAVEEAERSAWVEANGSERLRLLVARGFESQTVYVEERIALELPGWTTRRAALPPGRTYSVDDEEPRLPPLEVLQVLHGAGDGVELVYVGRWRPAEGDEEGGDDWEVRDGGIYLLRREHRGREVYRLAK